jgi:hypothetical protein
MRYSLFPSGKRDIAWNMLKFEDLWTSDQRTDYVDAAPVNSKVIEIVGCAPWTTRWANFT